MSPPPSRRRWTADPETNVRERNDENDKPNGVVAFPPLSEPLDLIGRVVTADAMHLLTELSSRDSLVEP